MKPKQKTNNLSGLLALLSTIAAIISNLGKDIVPVIRWGTVLAATLSIYWAIKNYPPHKFPRWLDNFYRKHRRMLQRGVSILVIIVGIGLLGFITFSIQTEIDEASQRATSTPAATSTPLPPLSPTAAFTPIVTTTPLLTATSMPTAIPYPTPSFRVVEKQDNLWCLAEKYYGNKNGHLYIYICKANQETGQIGNDCNELQVGEKLLIPTKRDFPWAPLPELLPKPGVEGVDYFCENP